jgi:hypothetical protein
MSTSSRNVLIACGVLILIACACVSLVGLGGLTLFISDREIVSGEINTVISPVAEEATPVRTDTIETPSIPASTDGGEAVPTLIPDDISAEIEREMDELQQQVIELRGLQSLRPVERSLLTSEQLREKVISDFFEDYSEEEAFGDAVVLAAFNLLDQDFDLYDFFIELYSEQVAGYYDDETEEMYVVRGSGFQGPERLTYTHEYNHVLQDQNFDIEKGLNYSEEQCELDSERCAATQALLEGDSTLLELIWFSLNATEEDQREIFEYYDLSESPIYDRAPDFMKEDFLFPYQAGQVFVETLYLEGGWDAVNDAYGNVPLSTEQILHPEKYPEDRPVNVLLPDLLGVLEDGWREIDKGVMGEWYTYLILAFGLDEMARLSENAAMAGADGWGGDMYAVYYDDEGDTALVLKTIWDADREAKEFKEQFEIYSFNRFGDPVVSRAGHLEWKSEEGYTEFHIDGDETIWIFAPDSITAHTIWDSLSTP